MFVDEADGQVHPDALAMYLAGWKRPSKLIEDVPGVDSVPVVSLKPEPSPDAAGDGGEDGASSPPADVDPLANPELGNRALVDEHALYFGNPALEWLFAAFRNVYERRDVVPKGGLLWENIYPQDDEGVPTVSPNGKYLVKLWVMNEWRCVAVDDRAPTDVFGTSLFVAVRPVMLWPLLLTKAVMKLMGRYGCLNAQSTEEVPVVQWLLGWEREALGVDVSRGALFDRVKGTLRTSARRALMTTFLRDRFERVVPPRIVALVGAPGIGRTALLDRVVERLPERFGRCVLTTSRPPMEHEEHGTHFWFKPRDAFEEYAASENPDDGFLERRVVADPRRGERSYHPDVRQADGTAFQYGMSFGAIRAVAAGGKLLLVALDLDGARAVKANPAVDSWIVRCDATREETLRERLRLRLKEHESTVQKRLEFARAEWETAQPGGPPPPPPPPSEEGAGGGADAEAETAAAERAEQTSYAAALLVDDEDDLYYQFKVQCASLSPIIRNRLLGLPAYVLDYSDVIPANETERPVVKPVVLTGPNFLEKAALYRKVSAEFPEVFAYPKIITTKPLEPKYPSEDEAPERPASHPGAPWSALEMEYVGADDAEDADAKFDARAGEFAVTWTSQFTHEDPEVGVTYRYGITSASVEAAARDERLLLVNLPSLEACEAFAATCAANEATMMPGRVGVPDGKPPLSVFAGPATIEEHERRLRAWLTESEESLDAILAVSRAEREAGEREGVYDAALRMDGDADADVENLLRVVSERRPDVIPPMRDSEEERRANTPKPIVFCGPSGVGKATLIAKLIEAHPDRFGVCASHTTRAPREGEEDGVAYHFVDDGAFRALLDEGGFHEHVERRPHGAPDESEEAPPTLYGVSRDALAKASEGGKIPVVVVDVAGAASLRSAMPDGAYVFVAPPSVDALEKRLRDQASAAENGGEAAPPPDEDDEEALAALDAAIAASLDKISSEMEGFERDDVFTDVVVNEDMDLAYADVLTAIARAHPGAVTPPPVPLVISGALGAKKEVVFEALLREFPDRFGFPVAVTTREPEPHETDGVHYEFVTRERFDALVEEGEFIESTEVIVGYDEWSEELQENPPIVVCYGTPRAEVKRLAREGKMPVLETDVAGAAAMRDAGLDAVYVFFAHPEADEAAHRVNLVEAGEAEDLIPERLEEAAAELAAAREATTRSSETPKNSSSPHTTPLYAAILPYEPHPARYARFKEQIALREPRVVPMSSAWGFGRARWDVASRVYGRAPLRVAVVGPAASGKSTVARALAKKYDVPLVYPGALLREAAYDAPTALGLEARRYLDATKTVPDDFMMELIDARVTREDCVARGWILDGFPHNFYQAAALRAKGHEPDKVFVLEVDHASVLERTEGRLIDPVTGDVYHRAFAPAEEGSEVERRLTIRHDDLEENVRNRLAKYDFSDAPVRSLYPATSEYVDGARPATEVLRDVVAFLELEDALHDEREILPALALKELEYEIRDACKYRRRCCVLLAEPGLVGAGREPPAWVDLAELEKTARCHLANFDPAQFAHAHHDVRLDLADIGPGGKLASLGKMIHVDSPEPTDLLVSLTVAPREPPAPVPPPATLALVGDDAEELASALAEAYPDIYAVAERQDVPEEEASDPEEEATNTEENQDEKPEADAEAEAETEADGDGDGSPAFTPEAYPGAIRAAELRLEGLCAVVCLDAAEAAAFHASYAAAAASEAEPSEGDPSSGDASDASGRPAPSPPALVCIGMPPPPPGSGDDEAAAPDDDGAAAGDAPPGTAFDAVVFPESADSVATLLEKLKSVAAVRARLPRRSDVDTSVCAAVLHEYDWHATGRPQRTVLSLATNQTESRTIRLRRGRRVMQLTIDPAFYFAASVRSLTTPFDMDEPQKMLEEKQLAAPAVAEGKYPEVQAGDWRVWFRRAFAVDRTTVVSAALEVADPAMSPHARFAVVDADGAGDVSHFVAGAAPPRTFEPNEHGYVLMAYSKALAPLPTGAWRLSALADHPFASFGDDSLDAQAPEIFTGRYRPNYAHLVCRFRVALKQRALIALHFESDVPAGFKVTVTDPEDGWETAQAEYLRGGHQGHLRGVELRRWHAYASLSVPATALEATEEGKYVVVEVKLQGDRCAFDVAPNGDLVAGASPFAAAAAGRSASDADLLASTRTIREKAKAPPSAINWRLTTYSDAPEGSTTWTEDDARARYLESTVEGWVSGDAQRASLGEEALQRREELRALLRTGENAPPTLKEVVDPSAPEGEEPKQLALEPEKARRVRRGGALVERARAEAALRPVPRVVDEVVVSSEHYADREEALRRSIEESKARLKAFAERREARREKFAEKEAARETTASFSEWRASKRAGMSDGFRTKRNAYLESIKPPPESVRSEGAEERSQGDAEEENAQRDAEE